jgi:hypothetical protein
MISNHEVPLNSLLSIDLPASAIDLVTRDAFENYTVSGPDPNLESILGGLKVDDLFPDGSSDQNLAKCCLAGLWLLHNFLEQSHQISQGVHTREGSSWHAIMHRLEGDFWNSKYWYRKVGDHPVFSSLPGEGIWNPNDFVDQCESAQSAGGEAARTVQQTAVSEWKALFEYCFNQATH